LLDQSIRIAILELHKKGVGARAIARAMKLSRGAVRGVIRAGSAEVPRVTRPEKADGHAETIRDLYALCKGNLIRVHEELEAKGVKLSYQALTGFCRRHAIGHEAKKPAGRYHFKPGEEMQHDTSPHDVHIGGHERRVQTASLVLCYSRLRFIQVYPTFNRFICKLFLHDALQYFGAAARRCMIDNTHVVVLKGTGAEMVPVPEMEAFGERYGFEFKAHEKGDANRSAHVERSFDHVDRNFLAGRKFADFADVNRAAVTWCDKVNGKFRKAIHGTARELFAAERPALQPLPLWTPDIYLLHHRIVDVEGYVHVDGQMYSVPYQLIGRQLEVRETKDKVLVFEGPRLVAEHERTFTFEKRRSTKEEHRPPRGQGGERLRESTPEERDLLAAEPALAEYAKLVKARGSNRWPERIRRLAQMRRDYPPKPFLGAVQTAAHYGLYDLDRLERMVLRNIATEYFVVPADRRPRTDNGEPDNEG
jgi:transposase